jgi:hypothetical protein
MKTSLARLTELLNTERTTDILLTSAVYLRKRRKIKSLITDATFNLSVHRRARQRPPFSPTIGKELERAIRLNNRVFTTVASTCHMYTGDKD